MCARMHTQVTMKTCHFCITHFTSSNLTKFSARCYSWFTEIPRLEICDKQMQISAAQSPRQARMGICLWRTTPRLKCRTSGQDLPVTFVAPILAFCQQKCIFPAEGQERSLMHSISTLALPSTECQVWERPSSVPCWNPFHHIIFPQLFMFVARRNKLCKFVFTRCSFGKDLGIIAIFFFCIVVWKRFVKTLFTHLTCKLQELLSEQI